MLTREKVCEILPRVCETHGILPRNATFIKRGEKDSLDINSIKNVIYLFCPFFAPCMFLCVPCTFLLSRPFKIATVAVRFQSSSGSAVYFVCCCKFSVGSVHVF